MKRIAHTLKGVAGNIGATILQGEAEGVETAIRERLSTAMVDARRASAGLSLAKLIDDIDRALPEVKEDAGESGGDGEQPGSCRGAATSAIRSAPIRCRK